MGPVCERAVASEPVIDADAKQARFKAVVAADQPIRPIRQIDIKVLDPRRPGVGERDLHAGARSPSGVNSAVARAAELDPPAADGETERAVDEHVAEGIADASAHRAEPRIGELPAGEAVFRPRDVEFGLGAEHDAAGLPVVAGAHTTRDAGGARRVIRDIGPLIAKLAAEIRTAPAVDTHHIGRRVARIVSGAGGASRRDRGRAADQAYHRGSPGPPSGPALAAIAEKPANFRAFLR